jgi:hypothetical protein
MIIFLFSSGIVNEILADINGKQILTRLAGVGECIQVGDLAKGMYILKIVTAEGNIERKLIKE